MNSNNIEEILKDIFGMSLLDAKKIENEIKYPGTIKVTVIRETRAQEEAK